MKYTHLLTECQDGLHHGRHISGPAAIRDEPKPRSDALIPWMVSLRIFLIEQDTLVLSNHALPATASLWNGRVLARDCGTPRVVDSPVTLATFGAQVYSLPRQCPSTKFQAGRTTTMGNRWRHRGLDGKLDPYVC